MIKCISHKKVYASRELAEDALIEVRTQYEYGTHKGPVAVYQCDDCGYFHLTSRGPVNERLEREMTSGKIKKEKEAIRWMEKIKRK